VVEDVVAKTKEMRDFVDGALGEEAKRRVWRSETEE